MACCLFILPVVMFCSHHSDLCRDFLQIANLTSLWKPRDKSDMRIEMDWVISCLIFMRKMSDPSFSGSKLGTDFQPSLLYAKSTDFYRFWCAAVKQHRASGDLSISKLKLLRSSRTTPITLYTVHIGSTHVLSHIYYALTFWPLLNHRFFGFKSHPFGYTSSLRRSSTGPICLESISDT